MSRRRVQGVPTVNGRHAPASPPLRLATSAPTGSSGSPAPGRRTPQRLAPPASPLRRLGHALIVSIGATWLTVFFFLVLPILQVLAEPPRDDMNLRDVSSVIDPPPPPPEEPEPEEPEEPEETPELEPDFEPLDLSSLEIALNPGMGGGWGAGVFEVRLPGAGGGADAAAESIFSAADLDQKPRVIYQPGLQIGNAVRRAGGGTVVIIFLVNEQGGVVNPKVQQSDHPALENPALAWIRQWKFEPGKRNGEPVQFRMRVPITFPEG